MNEALDAYLRTAARTGRHRDAVLAAAEAVARDPWDVVHLAGRCARARMQVADREVGLTAALEVVEPEARAALVRVPAGRPFPAFDGEGRRSRGAYDTPVDLARRVVREALAAVDGEARSGLDTACGTGAFLLAMAEAGVPEVYGTDLDDLALAVARIAVPRARLLREDALRHGPPVDVLCGNPPFVPPEHQDKALRAELRRRFPWLHGRFDLAVPFAATAVDRVRPGGACGLVLPFPALVQPYGVVLRRRWVERHRVMALAGPLPFAGAQVDVGLVVLRAGAGPAALPSGLAAEELLRLPNVPLDPALRSGDADLLEGVGVRCVPLGSLGKVDTGLVAHGPDGGKAELVRAVEAEGLRPYADAKEFFAGERLWIRYEPAKMHRAKSPGLFEPPKLVFQRLRGRGPVRAEVDLTGCYVGHTCTVFVPEDPRVDLEGLRDLVTGPLVDGLLRIARGQRMDLYPRDVASIPVPVAWLDDPTLPLEVAYGLEPAQAARLAEVAARPRTG